MKAKAEGADARNQQNARAANQRVREIEEKERLRLESERTKLQEDLRRQQEQKEQIAREEAERRNKEQPSAYPPEVRLRHLADRCSRAMGGIGNTLDYYLRAPHEKGQRWSVYVTLCDHCEHYITGACAELESATGINKQNCSNYDECRK
ncbi:hypothetical protein IVB27_36650 [Bradyrhizobium sp. 197]|uniref:hypothetical protein n=1 Tax=Bradyrhizobium sp. 197 TaxID=2782663 RepID=UPI001FF917CE|nr:hypothetical protein [Bradyrhizobium sp. 197]MCK1480120.1 hypothetical protein [Bradyrhizobium sp. 197]